MTDERWEEIARTFRIMEPPDPDHPDFGDLRMVPVSDPEELGWVCCVEASKRIAAMELERAHEIASVVDALAGVSPGRPIGVEVAKHIAELEDAKAELLGVLRDVEEQMSELGNCGLMQGWRKDSHARVLAAIAKATGEQP